MSRGALLVELSLLDGSASTLEKSFFNKHLSLKYIEMLCSMSSPVWGDRRRLGSEKLFKENVTSKHNQMLCSMISPWLDGSTPTSQEKLFKELEVRSDALPCDSPWLVGPLQPCRENSFEEMLQRARYIDYIRCCARWFFIAGWIHVVLSSKSPWIYCSA